MNIMNGMRRLSHLRKLRRRICMNIKTLPPFTTFCFSSSLIIYYIGYQRKKQALLEFFYKGMAGLYFAISIEVGYTVTIKILIYQARK